MPRLRRLRSAFIVILAGGVLGAVATLPGNLRPALGQTAGPPPTFITIVNPPPPPVIVAPPPPSIVVAAPPPPVQVVAAPPPPAVVVEAPPPPPAAVIAPLPPPAVEVRQPTVQGPAPAPKPAIQPAPRPALPRLPNTGTGGLLDRGSDGPAPAVFYLLASAVIGAAVAAIAYRELRRRI